MSCSKCGESNEREKQKKGSTPKSSNLGLYRAVVGSLSTPHNGTRYTVHTPHHPSPFSIQHSQIKLQPFSLMLVRVQGSLTSSPPQAREHALSKSQAWRTLPCDVLAPGELLLRYFSIEPWDWRSDAWTVETTCLRVSCVCVCVWLVRLVCSFYWVI